MTYEELYEEIGARPEDDDETVVRKLDQWADVRITYGGRRRLTDYVRSAVVAVHRRRQGRSATTATVPSGR